MNLQAIIDQLADEADDFLSAVGTRSMARAVLQERLDSEHPALTAGDRTKIVAGIMAILEKESFFVGGREPDEDEEDEGDDA